MGISREDRSVFRFWMTHFMHQVREVRVVVYLRPGIYLYVQGALVGLLKVNAHPMLAPNVPIFPRALVVSGS